MFKCIETNEFEFPHFDTFFFHLFSFIFFFWNEPPVGNAYATKEETTVTPHLFDCFLFTFNICCCCCWCLCFVFRHVAWAYVLGILFENFVCYTIRNLFRARVHFLVYSLWTSFAHTVIFLFCSFTLLTSFIARFYGVKLVPKTLFWNKWLCFCVVRIRTCRIFVIIYWIKRV